MALELPLVVALAAVALNGVPGGPAWALNKLHPWYMLILVFALRLVNPWMGRWVRSRDGKERSR